MLNIKSFLNTDVGTQTLKQITNVHAYKQKLWIYVKTKTKSNTGNESKIHRA